MCLDEKMATTGCRCGTLMDADYGFIDERCHDSGECPRTTCCGDIELVIRDGIVSDAVWGSNSSKTVSNCEPELAFESADEAV